MARMVKPRLLRITTVPISLTTLLRGQLSFMQSSFEVLTISADGREVAQLKSEGIAHRSVSFTRKITPLQDLVALVQLIRILRQFKPHIVHTHTPKAGLLGMLAAKLCRVPVRLHTVAGLPLMESRGVTRLLLNITERLTYFCSHRVYPNSVGLANFIQSEFNVKPPTLSVIGRGSSNGIDATFFSRASVLHNQVMEVNQRVEKKKEDVIFCFVGRLVRDKGIVELVEAFEALENPDVKLILVGQQEPELDPLPTKTLLRINSNPAIYEVGFQADVRPWLASSDALVFPSYREGFPNVVMQAACMELPCIVSDINGCNEIIQHDVSGIIVPAKNVAALKQAMQSMANNPAKGHEMGKKGRDFVAAHFGQSVYWNLILDEYLHQISNASSPAFNKI